MQEDISKKSLEISKGRIDYFLPAVEVIPHCFNFRKEAISAAKHMCFRRAKVPLEVLEGPFKTASKYNDIHIFTKEIEVKYSHINHR